MAFRKTLSVVALTAALMALSACDNAKQRAEKHYQTGLSYLQSGDVERALVEFRNVFKLDGNHREARRAYADAERDRGNLREAFSQYLRLDEQYPGDLETLRALASIASQAGDWDLASTYATSALAIAPDDVDMRAAKIAADYGTAVAANDVDLMLKAPAEARELLAKLPANLPLRRVVIDDLIRGEKYEEALTHLDAALKLSPDDRSLYAIRLTALSALGEDDQVEAGLIDLVERFPDAPEMSQALVRWYTSRSEIDKAEAFLRGRLQPGAADRDKEPILELVRFLADQRGPDAAIDALTAVIDSGATSPVYRAARAGFHFDLGQRDEAIEEMKTLLQDAPPSTDTRRAKVGLARMLSTIGNPVGARALVEEVLAEDSGDIEALKLKAGWLILDDHVGDAIATLRRAYDQNPRDASILTLMAQAYERDGNRDLMRESLSLAVQASNNAPAESLLYAQFLAGEGKLLPAEGVLIDSLRLSPGEPGLLIPLGQLYVQLQDWSRAEGIAKALESGTEPETVQAAQTLRAAIYGARQNSDQAIGYLQGLVDQGQGGLEAKIAILRTHLANDQNDKAIAYAAELLASDPENADLQFIDASVRALAGDNAGAEATYRKLIAQDERRLPVWLALARLVASESPARVPEAESLIDKALTIAPTASELRWAKAGFLERGGNIDGAIAIYEALYQENSGNPIIANNLASLLSNFRTDEDSLAKAELIARRLRGSNVAPYQDTYGWIAYLRGNTGEAEAELEKAAAGLPKDPMVRYHLAMTYLKRDRKPEALAEFQAALDLVEASDSRDFVTIARQESDRLTAEGVTIGN
ncbi:MAG: tetratricopeptide repeat protein [Rhodobacteraceae bacterium]|nr:tetratricopeptide repeat protein [Paracoccaceae bacterium]